jgi:hypothetical protein
MARGSVLRLMSKLTGAAGMDPAAMAAAAAVNPADLDALDGDDDDDDEVPGTFLMQRATVYCTCVFVCRVSLMP